VICRHFYLICLLISNWLAFKFLQRFNIWLGDIYFILVPLNHSSLIRFSPSTVYYIYAINLHTIQNHHKCPSKKYILLICCSNIREIKQAKRWPDIIEEKSSFSLFTDTLYWHSRINISRYCLAVSFYILWLLIKYMLIISYQD